MLVLIVVVIHAVSYTSTGVEIILQADGVKFVKFRDVTSFIVGFCFYVRSDNRDGARNSVDCWKSSSKSLSLSL